jgi:hypothetical protein
MKLKCLIGTSDLTVGREYVILEIIPNNNNVDWRSNGSKNWYRLIGDNGKEVKYLDFRFSCLEAEIRNNKIEKLLEE